jgi:DNA-binding transcriptional MerR regulator
MNKSERTFSIGDVEEILGLPKHRIRHWCDRYLHQVQRIQIGENVQRRFTERDIRVIRQIDRLMARGQTLKSAAEKAQTIYRED